MIFIDDTEPEGVLEPAFPYRDVSIQRNVDANLFYDILSEVGRGKFGTVYKCQEKTSGLKLAAKFVPIPKRGDRANVEREVEIMNSLQHHLIIQLYAAYEYQKMMCVVQELVEGGELFDRVVDDEFVLNERVCVVFIRQLCEAMEFMHRHNILHLDLKPENILCLTQEGNRIKLIDFGLARKFDPDKRLQILFGTPEFVAPEVVNFDCISYATDMWSVGVITYVLVSGLSPFMGETDIETMANVTIAKYDFEDESFSSVSPECIDFISKLLVKDVSIRMTASQCLQHKWLQRRPKSAPKLSPKSINVSAANKLKATTPSPIPTPIDLPENMEDFGETKELDTTKDNLKNFIERWEEHPNSPYVFDVEGNMIAPLNENECKKLRNNESITSSRVCSPSPCGSIDVITDDEKLNEAKSDSTAVTPINESHEQLFTARHSLTPTPTPAPLDSFASKVDELRGSNWNLGQRSLKSYLHTFDRRNSDTTCLLGRRTSSERVNLADEIKKLSDHLLILAEINTKLGKEVKTEADPAEDKTKSRAKDKGTGAKDKIKKSSPKSKASANKINATTTSETVTSTEASSATNFFKQINPSKTRTNNLSLRLQKSLDDTPTLYNNEVQINQTSTTTTTTANTTKVTSSSITSIKKSTRKAHVQEAASIKRAKFRISQMSRDVPVGLPDMHQTVNLEEAANNTKDCLLHLLEKYNEVKTRNPLGRHQSISISNFGDNLEYRSMSSINAFFQRHNNTGDNVKQLQAQLKDKTGK